MKTSFWMNVIQTTVNLALSVGLAALLYHNLMMIKNPEVAGLCFIAAMMWIQFDIKKKGDEP